MLQGAAVSARPGRRPKQLEHACTLEVVAIAHGSFEIALDFRRTQTALPGLDLGETALEKLVAGIAQIAGPDDDLPLGYDGGVLSCWRETGKLLLHGIDAIDLFFRTATVTLSSSFDSAVFRRITERARHPVQNLRTVEGRLLMADFNETRTRCQVHPPAGRPVECAFSEDLADVVYANLRSYVRVTGEAEEDAGSGRIRVLKITDLTPVELAAAGVPLDPSEFWREPPFDEVAADQGFDGPRGVDDLIGAGAALWEDDAALDAFVADIYGRRRDSRRREAGGT